MLAKIEIFFRDLLSTLQTAKMYTSEHPMFQKAVDKAFLSLQEVLMERQELVLGVVGEELAFEKEIFFDLSILLKPAILYLKDRGIERIAFYGGVTKDELKSFVVFLAMPKEELKGNLQESLSLFGVRNITIGKIAASEEAKEDKLAKSVNYLLMYENSLEKTNQSVMSVLNTQALDKTQLRFSINNIMENMASQYQEFLKFTTLKRYDIGTYVHLLNVSILSMYFSSKLGFAKEDVLDIGIAALFHDIGKLYISRKLIRKSEKLSTEEFDALKSHTILGAEIMLQYVDTLGMLPAVVSFEHHLKYDMQGYPRLKFVQPLHVASLIISICDVYDALSARRDYKVDYPPDMIHNLMIRDRGTSFDPDLLDKFFKIMGVWPIGSIVGLSDGRVAVVRDEHEDDVFSPRVEAIYPQGQRELIDLRQRKDIKIERYFNLWKEGKEFLALV